MSAALSLTREVTMDKHVMQDAGDAFLPDLVRNGGVRIDDEAEAVAEEVLATATSAEDAFESARDEFVPEEIGGPFVDEDDLATYVVRRRGAFARTGS